ncbi:hypothetical protein Rmag_1029 [Candidatus Ruthia magnifica str. Cm (Calyptogena magnifica)]|uniref:Uncharacterized protein n=1 Tax=Ruthia magnifica subsp. Calyptogena magnifica TaxID=413404 RepID=A1AXS7_RUTMC|nr:hypothetical protein Rmag_1029 [Candidatus Ruthia magnifica str. Cm (Calyptogena magnifica)]
MMTSRPSCFLNKKLYSALFRHINQPFAPTTVHKFSIKLVTLLSLLLISTQSISKSPIRLYKQYLIGTPKVYLQKSYPLKDCSAKYEKGTLCMQKHSLAGEEAEIAFRFLNDRLISIVLIMPLADISKVKKIFYALKTQFDLVLIEQGNNKLDIIKISTNTFNKHKLAKIIADFENEAYQKHNIKYTFISKKDFIIQSRKSRNFTDIFKNTPMQMRAATYSIVWKNRQVIGTISFIVPNITQSYLDQNPIVEDF